jgi:hypothetical protein
VGWRVDLQASNLFLARKFSEIEPFFMGKKFADQLVIQGMAGLIADEVTDDLRPHEPQVPDRIQYFVPYEFIGKAEPVFVQDPRIAHNHRVFQGSSPGESPGLQGFVFPEEPKGPGPTDFPFKVPVGDLDA